MSTSRIFAASGAVALGLLTLGTSLPATAAAPTPTSTSASDVAAKATYPKPNVRVLSVGEGTADLGYIRGAHAGTHIFVHQPNGKVKRCQISNRLDAACTIAITPGTVNTIAVTQAVGLDEDAEAEVLDLRIDARPQALDAPDVPLITNMRGDNIVIRVAGKPGAVAQVKNSNGTVVATQSLPDGNNFVGFSLLSNDSTPPTRQYKVTQSYAGVTSSSMPFRSDDLTLPPTGDLVAPTVESITKDGLDYFRVVVSTTGDSVVLRNSLKVIESTHWVQDGKAELWIRNTGAERHLAVSVESSVDGELFESSGTRFVLNEGSASEIPKKPTVESVVNAGSRAIVSTTGTPGATAKLTNSDGKTVAVKKLGATGTGQLSVPSASSAAGDLSLVQEISGVESDAAPVHVGDES